MRRYKKLLIISIIVIIISLLGVDLFDGKKEYDLFGGKFYGVKKVSDNPWGTNCGVIPLNDDYNMIFLTPGTTYVINVGSGGIEFDYSLSELVKGSSDGADLQLSYKNIFGQEIYKDVLYISGDDAWEYYSHKADGASSVIISCGDGGNCNGDADWVMIKKCNNVISDFGKNGYVKSVTYFGEEWPMNFWNSELETLDYDFEQITRDGFNSIIIVIPWKEFQPSTSPIRYNEYAFDNLNKVMVTAANHDLDVYARIGYTWDYYDDDNQNITERYLDLLRNQEMYDSWIDYCKKLYDFLNKYSNYKDSFLTWEDFWGCLSVCDNQDIKKRLQYSDELGYQEWIENNIGLNEFNSKYGTNYESVDIIPVPERLNPEMESFYAFFDAFLNKLLNDTQRVFPNISMEVRMDADLVTNISGEQFYYSHSKTFKCENSDFTATMYGIPMGFENRGERVTANEAIEHTKYILGNLVNQNGGKPVYIEQFLFLDKTPAFSYNAQIRDEEVGDYLVEVASVLRNYSKGYGLWVYRDYRTNLFYNSQFALGDVGWNPKGALIEKSDLFGSCVCTLEEGDSIYQSIPTARNHFPKEKIILEFEVKECTDATIDILIGCEKQEIEIDRIGNYVMEFSLDDICDFKMIMKKGMITIDNMYLYTHVQEGDLYDYNNVQESLMKNIRILNSELTNYDGDK